MINDEKIIKEVFHKLECLQAQNDIYHSQFGDTYHLALYEEFRKEGDIKFKTLNNSKLGGGFYLPSVSGGTIHTRKVIADKKEIQFEAEYSKNATLQRHHHSDCSESIEVLGQGKFKVFLGSKRNGTLQKILLKEGDILEIEKNVPHQVSNMSGDSAVLKIKFIKD